MRFNQGTKSKTVNISEVKKERVKLTEKVRRMTQAGRGIRGTCMLS